MGWPQCNTTLEDTKITETPVWNGWTFHYLGLWLSAIFGIIAVAVSFFVIYMHATHYLRPHEQRHIIRILFMVPIYAAVSFLSYRFYVHSVYFEVLRDCYEAFAIASFFSLLCAYLAEDLHSQKEYFRTITPRKWVWPMGWFQKCCGGERGRLRVPKSGLTWFNVIWVCVFQYCFIRVAMTCVAVITQVFDRYCLESLNPAFAHVWVMVIEATAVTIAMYCIIQFYIQIKGDIQQHSPLKKVMAIKLVIFLSFWQNLLISFLTSAGAIKPSDRFQTPDIKVGIPAMLLCIEMAIFAVFHIFAFSWRPYVTGSPKLMASIAADGKPAPDRYRGGPMGVLAIADAFNPWDLVKAIGRSARWLFVRRKHRHLDVSYQGTRMHSSIKPAGLDHEHDDIDGSTAYQASQPRRPLADDHQTLLSAAQPIPTGPVQYGPGTTNSSTYRVHGDEYYEPSDIGLAQSTHGRSRQFLPNPSQNAEPHPPPYHVPQPQGRQHLNQQGHELPRYNNDGGNNDYQHDGFPTKI